MSPSSEIIEKNSEAFLALSAADAEDTTGASAAAAEDEEGEDDLLSLVEAEATRPDAAGEGDDAGKNSDAGLATRDRMDVLASFIGDEHADIAYRFPSSRAALEIVPDIANTFGVRLAWHRGKTILSLFESTALRPVAEVLRAGQKYPIFLSQHARKRRDRVVLGGRRKAARSWRCALRCACVVQGRADRFSWLWRVTATAPAMALPETPGPDGVVPEDAVTLALPLSPGKHRILTLPGLEGRALAVWMNDIAISVVAGLAEASAPVEELAAATADGNAPEGVVSAEVARRSAPLGVPVLSADVRGVYLHLRGAQLGGGGTVLRWESWLNPARTEADALAALLKHVADAADRAQIPTADLDEARTAFAPFLNELADASAEDLMRDDRVDKRGVDKQMFRATPGVKADRHLYGEGADAALAAATILSRYHMTGNDALRRRARLLANGVCEAQINIEDSPHWGAVWDALHKKKVWADVRGEKLLSVATTARAAKGLHLLHAHFEVDLYQRTALHAAQWLLLKMDPYGLMAGERFEEAGPPLPDPSPWTMVEALTPLAETFRVTGNEVYLKAALRVVKALKEGLAATTLPLSVATTEHLASAIEGVLLVSREYESGEMIALAQQIGLGLRARRLPDGSVGDPTDANGAEPLCPAQPNIGPTLASARAAIALSRVDPDPRWPIFALRALRAARRMVQSVSEPLPVALLSALTALPTSLLLAVAQRIKDGQADLDRVSVTRGWQTFSPDPATNEYIRVSAPGTGERVDHLALVCPVTQQVLIAVLVPPDMEEVEIVKNSRRPFVRSLLTGDYDVKTLTVPLGDGEEARIGVYLADT